MTSEVIKTEEIKAIMWQISLIQKRIDEISSSYLNICIHSLEPLKPIWLSEEEGNKKEPLLKAIDIKNTKINKLLGI